MTCLVRTILLVFFSTINSNIFCQCTISVASNNGYKVEVNLTPIAIIAPSSCPWGYNYNVEIAHQISFTGSNIPASLYTLQGTISCGNNTNNFFDLPNSGGTGTTVTVGNPYNNNSDCAEATVESLDCNFFTLEIHGPGMPYQKFECSFTLPVELIDFSAKVEDEKVLLSWLTGMEINNNYFEVERSRDGSNWEVIQQIEPVEILSDLNEYKATDRTPLEGFSYYRLKQVDLDGTSHYSEIEAIDFKKNESRDFLVFPNPSSGPFFINGKNIEQKDISFFHISGKNIQSDFKISKISETQFKVNSYNLRSGLYFIKIRAQVRKIYIQ